MGYSFVISTSIRQVKDLELILSVPFTCGSCCCEPTSRSQRSSPYKKQTIARLQKQNKSTREIAGTLGAAKSSVCYILRKKDSTGELCNINDLDVHGQQ